MMCLKKSFKGLILGLGALTIMGANTQCSSGSDSSTVADPTSIGTSEAGQISTLLVGNIASISELVALIPGNEDANLTPSGAISDPITCESGGSYTYNLTGNALQLVFSDCVVADVFTINGTIDVPDTQQSPTTIDYTSLVVTLATDDLSLSITQNGSLTIEASEAGLTINFDEFETTAAFSGGSRTLTVNGALTGAADNDVLLLTTSPTLVFTFGETAFTCTFTDLQIDSATTETWQTACPAN